MEPLDSCLGIALDLPGCRKSLLVPPILAVVRGHCKVDNEAEDGMIGRWVQPDSFQVQS